MVVLKNDAVRLACEPELGARITSLVDRRNGREWLVPGTLPGTAAAWAAEGAVFGGDEAFGWDECLPTVARCPDPVDATAPALRDHGDAVGPAGRRRGDRRPAGRDLDAVALAAPVPARHHARGRGGRLRIRAGDQTATRRCRSCGRCTRCSRWNRVRASSSNRVGSARNAPGGISICSWSRDAWRGPAARRPSMSCATLGLVRQRRCTWTRGR